MIMLAAHLHCYVVPFAYAHNLLFHSIWILLPYMDAAHYFDVSGVGRSTSDLKLNMSGVAHHAVAGRNNSDLKWKYVGSCTSCFYQEVAHSESHPK